MASFLLPGSFIVSCPIDVVNRAAVTECVLTEERMVMSMNPPSPVPMLSLADYNYEHFRTKHFLADLRTTLRGAGVQPGDEAPDFELEATDGRRVRLSDLRGTPVLLHFGSFT